MFPQSEHYIPTKLAGLGIALDYEVAHTEDHCELLEWLEDGLSKLEDTALKSEKCRRELQKEEQRIVPLLASATLSISSVIQQEVIELNNDEKELRQRVEEVCAKKFVAKNTLKHARKQHFLAGPTKLIAADEKSYKSQRDSLLNTLEKLILERNLRKMDLETMQYWHDKIAAKSIHDILSLEPSDAQGLAYLFRETRFDKFWDKITLAIKDLSEALTSSSQQGEKYSQSEEKREELAEGFINLDSTMALKFVGEFLPERPALVIADYLQGSWQDALVNALRRLAYCQAKILQETRNRKQVSNCRALILRQIHHIIKQHSRKPGPSRRRSAARKTRIRPRDLR